MLAMMKTPTKKPVPERHTNELGQFHRVGGPAIVEVYWRTDDEEPTVLKESWYINGQRHRAKGPAMIEYWPTGAVRKRHYYFNGKLHNARGPALEILSDYSRTYKTTRVDDRITKTELLLGHMQSLILCEYYIHGVKIPRAIHEQLKDPKVVSKYVARLKARKQLRALVALKSYLPPKVYKALFAAHQVS